jgi:hypothetical protein
MNAVDFRLGIATNANISCRLERARRRQKSPCNPELLADMKVGFRDCVVNGRFTASEIPEI